MRRKQRRCLDVLGFLPIKLPLHEIRSLPVDAGAIPDDAAAVAVTSANAIRHAPDVVIERLKHLPCYTVGEATAGTAAYAGFSTVIEGGGDAESLAERYHGSSPGRTARLSLRKSPPADLRETAGR